MGVALVSHGAGGGMVSQGSPSRVSGCSDSPVYSYCIPMCDCLCMQE